MTYQHANLYHHSQSWSLIRSVNLHWQTISPQALHDSYELQFVYKVLKVYSEGPSRNVHISWSTHPEQVRFVKSRSRCSWPGQESKLYWILRWHSFCEQESQLFALFLSPLSLFWPFFALRAVTFCFTDSLGSSSVCIFTLQGSKRDKWVNWHHSGFGKSMLVEGKSKKKYKQSMRLYPHYCQTI